MRVGEGVGEWGCECCERVQGFIQGGGGIPRISPTQPQEQDRRLPAEGGSRLGHGKGAWHWAGLMKKLL